MPSPFPFNSVLTPPRPTYDLSTLSKRQRIMMYFEDTFSAIQAGQDGYLRTFTAVSRKPFTKQEQQSGDAVAFYDLSESKTAQMQFQLCELTVFAEFYHQMAVGDNPADAVNMILTDVQRGMRKDVTCGGLAINCVEKKNQADVNGPLENFVVGLVEFVVTYRHAADDPRR